MLRKQTGNFNHCISIQGLLALPIKLQHCLLLEATRHEYIHIGGFLFAICLESFVENSQRRVQLLLPKEPSEVPKVRYWTRPGFSSWWPLPSPVMTKSHPLGHRNYLGDGRERRQPEPPAGCAWEADSSAQVAVVDVTAAQHVQSTGNGVATPVRDPCKEWHCQTKLHKLAAQCPECVRDTWVRNGETWAQGQYGSSSLQAGPCWISLSHCEFYPMMV